MALCKWCGLEDTNETGNYCCPAHKQLYEQAFNVAATTVERGAERPYICAKCNHWHTTVECPYNDRCVLCGVPNGQQFMQAIGDLVTDTNEIETLEGVITEVNVSYKADKPDAINFWRTNLTACAVLGGVQVCERCNTIAKNVLEITTKKGK